MNAMKTYTATIIGTTSMLQNRLSKDILDEKKAIPNDKKEEWDNKNYLRKAYSRIVNGTQEYTVDERCIHGMLISAAKKYKTPPPRSVGKTWTEYVKSCLLITEDVKFKYGQLKPYGCMVNGNPSSAKKGSKVWSVRPMFSDWRLTFSVNDVGDYMDEKTFTELLKIAGLFIGLSDYRPIFGRFHVHDVRVEEISND